MPTPAKQTALSVVRKPDQQVMSANPDAKLTTDEIVAICNKAGVAPTAVNYEPEFLDRVYVLGPDTGAQQVSPMYCLSLPSAIELCFILSDLYPVLWKGEPTPFSGGSPFHYSEDVPWATFSNGAQRNLGTLAYYWRANNGDPGGLNAERNARTDIAFG